MILKNTNRYNTDKSSNDQDLHDYKPSSVLGYLSHFLSWIFLPLLMPIYGLALTMYIPSEPIKLDSWTMFTLPPEVKNQLLLVFFIIGALLPALSFMELHRRKIISTIDMENRLERSIPLIIQFAFCLMLFVVFLVKAPENVLPKYFYALPLSGILVTVLFMFINRWIKISLHAGGAGILVGYLFAFFIVQANYNFWIFIGAIMASGLTIFARLYLNKHRPIEVYTGWSLAFLITALSCLLYPAG